jgi:hypothetical protein
MFRQTNHDHVAAIHQVPLKEGIDPIERLRSGMGIELIKALNERGVAAHVTRGLGAYSLDGTVSTWTLGDDETMQQEEGSWQEFEVIRDIAGGFGRTTNGRIVSKVANKIPIINGPAVRQGDDKAFMAKNNIFENRQPNTIATRINGQKRLIQLLGDTFEGGVVYAKPARGAGSSNIYRIDLNDPQYSEVLSALCAAQDGKKMVLQEEIKNNGPLPSSIKPENEEQAALMEKYKGAKKELRIFWFFGRDCQLDWMPVVRLTEEKGTEDHKSNLSDRYAYIDRDTVPAELIDFTLVALNRFSNTVGVIEMSGAFDFAYGTTASKAEPDWWVMEGNFWQPVPPSKKENPALRKEFVGATADQIRRVASSRTDRV